MIRRIDTKSTFKIYCPNDPSVKFIDAEAKAKYMKTGDINLIEVTPTATTFHCRMMGGRARRDVQSIAFGEDTVEMNLDNMSKIAVATLKHSVFAAQNFYEEGDYVKFPRGLDDDALDIIDVADQLALGSLLNAMMTVKTELGDDAGK